MTPLELEQPRRVGTLREQLVATLRQAVLTGKLPPGSRLVEMQLADQFGVSRGPVREAIRQLVEEGLVDQVPYKGTIVRPLSPQAIEEIYSYRILLESFAFELVWHRRTFDFFRTLDARHDSLKQAIREQDKQLAISCEMDLHATVYEFAQHSLLLDSWTMLRGHLHRYFTVHQSVHERAGALFDAHERYVELAKGDDLSAMLGEIEEHMQRGLGRLLEFVRAWNE